MGERAARNPDGRVWTVAVRRFQPPRWRQSDYEPGGDDTVFVVFEYAYAVLVWFVVPLAIAVVELPVAFVRSLFSAGRWIDATSDDASPIRIVWRAHRDDADRAADEVAERLGRGYTDVTPAGAELAWMSAPPGFADLDA